MDDGSGNAISGTVRIIEDGSDLNNDPPCSAIGGAVNTSPATWLSGKATTASSGNRFGLLAGIGVTGTFRIWII
jgi:hypothetical protein